MRRQRGVALLLAVLAVALAALLAAALLDQSERSSSRARERLRAEQAWQLHLGLEAWAGEALRQAVRADLLRSAQALPPVDVPGARIQGRLRDAAGCFNLNTLAPGGLADAAAVARFERLLARLGLDPAIAGDAADFIDADGAGGGEDAAYVGLRTPGRALAHASELRPLRGLAGDAWQRLAPFVCALPAGQGTNLNSAPPELWALLDARLAQPALAARLAVEGEGGYRDMDALRAALAREGIEGADLGGIALRSEYFLAESEIDADGIVVVHSSLLRLRDGRVHVLARARGLQ
ncbi:type II secretion system minor pseudopilin GspK [Coralloluteibacterium thermophilus]|uniref:Type II secretion system protein K n=1 Tax=Coralloluteibacterium thermophilum TaxID=2707049 RepID=A0ABV9NPQ1_9GAMM